MKVIYETERLIIRQWEKDDYQDLFEYASNSPVADDYMRVAEYMIGRKARPKSWTPARWGQIANAAYKKFMAERSM